MQNTIAECRRERGWSQETLADALGVSRRTVISIESGQFNPSLPTAFRLAAIFERPIEQLFAPDPEG